ncbi:MAG: NAD(P)-binding domain-containing protein [Planctomycetia bacterium]
MTSPALQEIIALLGCPAAGNPAQYLYERALAEAGLDWRFLTLDVAPERVGAAIAGVDAMGFRGCVLSGPLRGAATAHVATLSPTATFSRAVSLVERQPTGLVGHMTDGRGLLEALRAHADPTGAGVLLVGAGPAARAAALELSLAGAAEIIVCNRTPDAATALVEALAGVDGAPAAALPWHAEIVVPEQVGIVVSAVPPEAQFTLAGLRKDHVVADFALVPQPSPAVAAAQKQGACTIDGLEIHCAKTAIDFHTWTGIEPDTDLLRELLDEYLNA